MKQADVNRAIDKAESLSEVILLDVIGLPKPWTAVVLGLMLFLAGIGAAAIYRWL